MKLLSWAPVAMTGLWLLVLCCAAQEASADVVDECTLEHATGRGEECIEVSSLDSPLTTACDDYLVRSGFCSRCISRAKSNPHMIFCRPRQLRALPSDWHGVCAPSSDPPTLSASGAHEARESPTNNPMLQCPSPATQPSRRWSPANVAQSPLLWILAFVPVLFLAWRRASRARPPT